MNIVVRIIVGIVMSFVAWFALTLLIGVVVNLQWPAFAAANHAFNTTQTMLFDQPMMITRLSIAAFSSIVAAWLTALTLRDNSIAPLVGGLALLAFFIPVHLGIWDKFPLWYHLTFLPSLPILAFIGGKLARS